MLSTENLADKYTQFEPTQPGFANMILSDSATNFLVGSVIISAGASENEAVIRSTMEAAVIFFANKLNDERGSTTSMNKEEWIEGIKSLLNKSIQKFAGSSSEGDDFLRSIGIREEAIREEAERGARRDLLISHMEKFLDNLANDRESGRERERDSDQYQEALGEMSKEEIQILLKKLKMHRVELPYDRRSDLTLKYSEPTPYNLESRERDDVVEYKTKYVGIIAGRLKGMKENLISLLQNRTERSEVFDKLSELSQLLEKIIPKLKNLDDEIDEHATSRSVPINRLKDIIDEFAKIGFLGFNPKTDSFSMFVQKGTVAGRDAIVDLVNTLFGESIMRIKDGSRIIFTRGDKELIDALRRSLKNISALFETKYPAGGRRRTKKHVKKHHARTHKKKHNKKTHKRRANKKRRKTMKKRR